METRSLLKKRLVSSVKNPHFAIVKYWDYFYLYAMNRLNPAFFEDGVFYIHKIFEDRNSGPGYSVGNTSACVKIIGEWYWEDVITHYAKEFKKI